MIASILLVNTLYIIVANAELPIPKAVLIKASEIPFANATESGEPADANAANARIIPNTVPKRAIKVETYAIVAITTKFFSKPGNSNVNDSSNSF